MAKIETRLRVLEASRKADELCTQCFRGNAYTDCVLLSGPVMPCGVFYEPKELSTSALTALARKHAEGAGMELDAYLGLNRADLDGF